MTELSPEVARLLVCPGCSGELAHSRVAFSCQGCGAVWPIVEEIPRFVDSEHYVGTFGFQWRRHRRTQLDSARRRESEATFAEKTGLSPEDVRGKVVLDVGVGSGRFADVVARWGGTPVGIDLSLAVVAARRNLSGYPGAFVGQADLFKLPFRREAFDHVYSIGVLHHTPSTRAAFRAVAPLVKPGGVVAVGIYEESGPAYEWSNRYRRYTTAMSCSLLHALSHVAVPMYHAANAVEVLLGSTAANALRRALPTRVHEDPQWRILDTYDWYAPRYQWLHDEAEVKRWFTDLGFEDVRRLSERTMVSVRGRRPPGPLATPPESDERRGGAVAPLPGFVPERGTARDLVLLSLLATEVLRSFALAGPAVLGSALREAITASVVRTKKLLGVEGDLLRRAPETARSTS